MLPGLNVIVLFRFSFVKMQEKYSVKRANSKMGKEVPLTAQAKHI